MRIYRAFSAAAVGLVIEAARLVNAVGRTVPRVCDRGEVPRAGRNRSSASRAAADEAAETEERNALRRAEHRLERARGGAGVRRAPCNAANALANHMALDRRVSLRLRWVRRRALARGRRRRGMMDAVSYFALSGGGRRRHAGCGRRHCCGYGIRDCARPRSVSIRRLAPRASGFEAELAFRGI